MWIAARRVNQTLRYISCKAHHIAVFQFRVAIICMQNMRAVSEPGTIVQRSSVPISVFQLSTVRIADTSYSHSPIEAAEFRYCGYWLTAAIDLANHDNQSLPSGRRIAQIHTVASRKSPLRFDIIASCPRWPYRYFEALQNELRGNVEQEEDPWTSRDREF